MIPGHGQSFWCAVASGWSAQDATEDCKYPIAGDAKRVLPDEHNRICWEVELYKMVGMMRCVL